MSSCREDWEHHKVLQGSLLSNIFPRRTASFYTPNQICDHRDRSFATRLTNLWVPGRGGLGGVRLSVFPQSSLCRGKGYIFTYRSHICGPEGMGRTARRVSRIYPFDGASSDSPPGQSRYIQVTYARMPWHGCMDGLFTILSPRPPRRLYISVCDTSAGMPRP